MERISNYNFIGLPIEIEENCKITGDILMTNKLNNKFYTPIKIQNSYLFYDLEIQKNANIITKTNCKILKSNYENSTQIVEQKTEKSTLSNVSRIYMAKRDDANKIKTEILNNFIQLDKNNEIHILDSINILNNNEKFNFAVRNDNHINFHTYDNDNNELSLNVSTIYLNQSKEYVDEYYDCPISSLIKYSHMDNQLVLVGFNGVIFVYFKKYCDKEYYFKDYIDILYTQKPLNISIIDIIQDLFNVDIFAEDSKYFHVFYNDNTAITYQIDFFSQEEDQIEIDVFEIDFDNDQQLIDMESESKEINIEKEIPKYNQPTKNQFFDNYNEQIELQNDGYCEDVILEKDVSDQICKISDFSSCHSNNIYTIKFNNYDKPLNYGFAFKKVQDHQNLETNKENNILSIKKMEFKNKVKDINLYFPITEVRKFEINNEERNKNGVKL